MRDARLRFRELQQNSAESFSPGEGLKSSISLSRGEERTRNHFPAGKTDTMPNKKTHKNAKSKEALSCERAIGFRAG